MIVTFGPLAVISKCLNEALIQGIALPVAVLKSHDPLFSESEHDAMMIQYRMTEAAIFSGRSLRYIACTCVLSRGERTGRAPAIRAGQR